MIFHRLWERLKQQREVRNERRRRGRILLSRELDWPPDGVLVHLPRGMGVALERLNELAQDTKYPDSPFYAEPAFFFRPSEDIKWLTWGIADILEAEEKQTAFMKEYVENLEYTLRSPTDAVAYTAVDIPPDLVPLYIRERFTEPYTREMYRKDDETTELYFGHPLTREERDALPLVMREWYIYAATNLLGQIRPVHRERVKGQVRIAMLYLVDHYRRVVPERERLRERIKALEDKVKDRFPDFLLKSELA
ncbi:MAG: hypothetical protein GHCLOJNM_00186 [bacterium]|nr:hypothetical protein [bacterium]